MKASNARYTVVGFALTLGVIMYIQRVAIAAAAPSISIDLNLDKAQMGTILGAFSLTYALFEIPMGLWGDKVGVRRVLLQIVMAWSFFTAITGVAWNFVSLWIIRLLFGAGEAGCFPNLTKMLSLWLPRATRVRAQALMWAFARWGGAVTPLLTVPAIHYLGWRWAFVAFGLLGVAWWIAFATWFKDDPAQHPSVNEAERKLIEDGRQLATHGAAESALSLLLKPQVLLLLVQYFFFSFVWIFYITWLPTYLQEAHGLSAAQTAGLAALPLFFGGFGSIVSGLLPIRLPRRVLAIGSFLITAALLFSVTHIQDATIAMVCMALASFFSDLTMPISWNSCVEIGRQRTATLAGAMNMFGNLGGFVAPMLGGFILQGTLGKWDHAQYPNQVTGGDWNLLLYVMVGAAIFSAVCWLFLDPEAMVRRQNEAELAKL